MKKMSNYFLSGFLLAAFVLSAGGCAGVCEDGQGSADLAVTATSAPTGQTAWKRPYRIDRLNRDGIPPLLEGVSTAEQWQAKREEIMAAWRETVGTLPPRPLAEVTILEEVEFADHTRQKITYPSSYGDTVTAYLLLPKGAAASAPLPAMLALHPTNATGKDSVATAQGRKNRMYGLELVRRGYVVLAPDAMTSGERIFPGYGMFNSEEFYRQHPQWSTVGKNLTDHLQAMDVLAAHPLVDAERIGAIGHSFGAYNAYFLSSVDDRVKVVVASCGVSPFARTNDPQHWGVRPMPYTHFPKIAESLQQGEVPFEFNEIVALTAPRPQFYYAAEGDRIFQNWKEIGDSFADVASLYKFSGDEDSLVTLIGNGAHDFPPLVRSAAYEFIDGVLGRSLQGE